MGTYTPTILCVIDNDETRQTLTALLRQEGYRVITDKSKANARGKLRNCIFDLLILDVRLSDGTGIELCYEIREADKTLPILFYTSEQDIKYLEEAVRAGAQAYLSPLHYPAVLKELIFRFTKASRSQ